MQPAIINIPANARATRAAGSASARVPWLASTISIPSLISFTACSIAVILVFPLCSATLSVAFSTYIILHNRANCNGFIENIFRIFYAPRLGIDRFPDVKNVIRPLKGIYRRGYIPSLCQYNHIAIYVS